MCEITVTVFNLYRSKQLGVSTWYPHVIKANYFNADRAANIAKTGLENADSAKLHIPYKNTEGKVMIGELQYLDPKAWDNQTNDMYGKTITFTEGEDFFYIGEFSETPVNDSNYAQGTVSGFKDYMNRNHDRVYTIKTAGMYHLIPHFEIGGA